MKMKNEERTRRNSTRIIAAVLLTMVMIMMLSSQVDASKRARAKKVPLKKIELNVHKVALNKGSKKTVKVKFFPKKAAAKKKVKWKSSKKSIASVKKGVITAKRPGKAVISAKVGKRIAKCTVVVTSPLKGIKLNKTEIELKKGSSFKLTVSYNPSDTTDSRAVKWSSNDLDVAAVRNGTITANSRGDAVITARIGNFEARCKVKVTVPLKSISLDNTQVEVNKGEERVLNVSYDPEDTTDNKSVTWSSSAPGIVSVENGKIKALAGGSAVITARVGSHSAKCNVTVRVPLKRISLSSSSMNINRGSSQKLEVYYDPADTTDDKTVRWSSSNTAVATVNNGNVYAKNGGSAVITAKVGSCTAKCHVTVRVPLSKIVLSRKNITISKGYRSELRVTCYPFDTTDDKTAVWSSSNTSVATVSKGKVYAKSNGSAVITAKVGNCTDSCKVTVITKLNSISLNKTKMTLVKNTSGTLNVSYNPTDTSEDRTVKWTSNNTSVATISKGKVYAKKGGNATITAKVGTKYAYCSVTVKNASVIDAKVTVSGQKVTVKGTKHAYSGADKFKACLYNNSRCKSSLAEDYSKGTMTFSQLNPGQKYYIKVYDCKTSREYDNSYIDSARIYTIKAGKTTHKVFTSKKAVTNTLLNMAKTRKQKLTFYFPTSQKEGHFTNGEPLFDTKNGGIAYMYFEEKEGSNLYCEIITINGKRFYKYVSKVLFEYSKSKQKSYLSKIYSLKKALTGSTVNRVKKANNFFITKCKYDYSYKRYSGYDALVGGRAVCEGYARAASIVLNMSGVKCEYVEGRANGSNGWDGHAWNIVKVGSKWYYCDFCWNSCIKSKTKYLLKGTKDKVFNSSHKLGSHYKTKAWKKAHPMASGNY